MTKFDKLVTEIGNSSSVPVNKLIQRTNVKLYQLGEYQLPESGLIVDLSEYFIDSQGDMYSLNNDTYFTKYGIILKILSNTALVRGYIVNSFRAKSGHKVTIRRSKLIMMMYTAQFRETSFDNLPVVSGRIDTKNFLAQA